MIREPIKVKDLINILSNIDPEKEVFIDGMNIWEEDIKEEKDYISIDISFASNGVSPYDEY